MIKKSLFFAFFLLFVVPAPWAGAKVYIDIDAPAGRKLPIAVQELKDLDGPGGSDSEAVKLIAKEIRSAINSDLDFSGFFDTIDKAAYLEDPGTSGFESYQIDFSDWRAVGAEVLIKGGLRIEGDKLIVELRLFDTVKQKLIVGKRYRTGGQSPRLVAHMFADTVLEALTGERGVFATQLLFVSDRTGAKELYIADFDGRNVTQLTNNKSINLSPRWSPDGKKVLYTSYKEGWPYLYILNLETWREDKISNKPGINIGGRWSPDARKVALTLSIDRSPELYVLDLEKRFFKRLTYNHAIDVSPEWSPEGDRLAYVSDTAGNPHIYSMPSVGGEVTRLTYEGKYNTSPAWSPDGEWIAFTRKLTNDDGFNIWVMRSDGSDKTQLTHTGTNESPSWSPNGKYIVFSSKRSGQPSSLYIMRYNGRNLRRIDMGKGSEKAPAWSPYKPMILFKLPD